MTKFVQAMIDRVIKKHVDNELLSLSRVEAQKEKYLAKFHELYGKYVHFNRAAQSDLFHLDLLGLRNYY